MELYLLKYSYQTKEVGNMDIVLRNNLILITTGFDTLNTPWMREFLNHHTRGMLFLPKAVLVFRNESLKDIREEFLHQLSAYHAKVHDFNHEFFYDQC